MLTVPFHWRRRWQQACALPLSLLFHLEEAVLTEVYQGKAHFRVVIGCRLSFKEVGVKPVATSRGSLLVFHTIPFKMVLFCSMESICRVQWSSFSLRMSTMQYGDPRYGSLVKSLFNPR